MHKQDWIILIIAILAIGVLVNLGPYGERTELSQSNHCEVTRNPAGYKGGAITELSNECKP